MVSLFRSDPIGENMIERYAKNLNYLTLPEIKDFNALGDTLCIKYFVKRYKGRVLPVALIAWAASGWGYS
ncbi:MAG: hypothetical protein CSA68_12080 [Rhodobacterales bacterium]|nr:MAG: hypothetical protein CSA68_12080 [Rhodobacterales bacterium]